MVPIGLVLRAAEDAEQTACAPPHPPPTRRRRNSSPRTVCLSHAEQATAASGASTFFFLPAPRPICAISFRFIASLMISIGDQSPTGGREPFALLQKAHLYARQDVPLHGDVFVAPRDSIGPLGNTFAWIYDPFSRVTSIIATRHCTMS